MKKDELSCQMCNEPRVPTDILLCMSHCEKQIKLCDSCILKVEEFIRRY